ncbi:short-chain dehydrogenase/reductase [Mycolicibacterium sp.]|uniref:short-chain dehydrogenase/reductase n=1 Tax=Mycolicibacterium sp. TaxID=2320850 RepID=UPI001A1D2ADD|nr:short-chain dehydrogenase/reductase [Mycolicibacterium sp.]MBJ7337895.1 SDR family NAD(P)-dependent oxidoreductase [Mycolicibacterium sp.]
MKHSIAGKTVLITGAAGGIGSASARALHRRGANVVLTDLRQESVDVLAGELGESRTLAVSVDVTKTADLRDAVAAAVDRFGSLDVVFANAGIAADPPATVASIDPDEFERVVEVDFLGVWRTVRAALPQVIANRGHVLITSSTYAFVNGLVNAPYAASKAAVHQLGRTLRVELAASGATAGVLYPGWVKTDIANVAFGGHDTITEMRARSYPPFLRNAIDPSKVGERVAEGIAKRSPRIVVPSRWNAYVALNGILNPLSDLWLTRDRTNHGLLARLEADRITRP